MHQRIGPCPFSLGGLSSLAGNSQRADPQYSLNDIRMASTSKGEGATSRLSSYKLMESYIYLVGAAVFFGACSKPFFKTLGEGTAIPIAEVIGDLRDTPVAFQEELMGLLFPGFFQDARKTAVLFF